MMYETKNFSVRDFRKFLEKNEEEMLLRRGMSESHIYGILKNGNGFAYNKRNISQDDARFFCLLETFLEECQSFIPSAFDKISEIKDNFYFSYALYNNLEKKQTKKRKKSLIGDYVLYKPSVYYSSARNGIQVVLSHLSIEENRNGVLKTVERAKLSPNDRRTYTGYIWFEDNDHFRWKDVDKENNVSRYASLVSRVHEEGITNEITGIGQNSFGSKSKKYSRNIILTRINKSDVDELKKIINCYDKEDFPREGINKDIHERAFNFVCENFNMSLF